MVREPAGHVSHLVWRDGTVGAGVGSEVLVRAAEAVEELEAEVSGDELVVPLHEEADRARDQGSVVAQPLGDASPRAHQSQQRATARM